MASFAPLPIQALQDLQFVQNRPKFTNWQSSLKEVFTPQCTSCCVSLSGLPLKTSVEFVRVVEISWQPFLRHLAGQKFGVSFCRCGCIWSGVPKAQACLRFQLMSHVLIVGRIISDCERLNVKVICNVVRRPRCLLPGVPLTNCAHCLLFLWQGSNGQ